VICSTSVGNFAASRCDFGGISPSRSPSTSRTMRDSFYFATCLSVTPSGTLVALPSPGKRTCPRIGASDTQFALNPPLRPENEKHHTPIASCSMYRRSFTRSYPEIPSNAKRFRATAIDLTSNRTNADTKDFCNARKTQTFIHVRRRSFVHFFLSSRISCHFFPNSARRLCFASSRFFLKYDPA
jgi:hypothetical protein